MGDTTVIRPAVKRVVYDLSVCTLGDLLIEIKRRGFKVEATYVGE